MGRLGTISRKTPDLRFYAPILLMILFPIALDSDVYGLENDDFSVLDEKIQSFENLLSTEQLPLGKINYELSSINSNFQDIQNSLKTSNNHFEFSKYKNLSEKYLNASKKLKEKLQDEQKHMEMDEIMLSIQIRKNIAIFQNSDRQITNSVMTQLHVEKERLMSDSREYIQDTLNEVIVEKHFESYSPQINWLDVYKSAFNKIQKDKKFHAIPMTIDRLMLQYHDEDLLQELLLLRLDIELLIDETTEEETYSEDDDPPPPPQEEEPEGEEEGPPGTIVPSPRTSLGGELNLSLNEAISETIYQITNVVGEHEKDLQLQRLQSSTSSSSAKSSGSGAGGSGGSGETGSGVGDRPRDDNKADF